MTANNAHRMAFRPRRRHLSTAIASVLLGSATSLPLQAQTLEEVVVTADGCKVITLFPCEELMVANAY